MWEGTLPHKSVVERAIVMLAAFGVKLELSQPSRQNLTELSEIRNIVLHKGGYVDQRFVDRCPWLGCAVGEQIAIDQDRMDVYFQAAIEFASALIGELAKSPFLFIKKP